jgi:hypothetical protein
MTKDKKPAGTDVTKYFRQKAAEARRNAALAASPETRLGYLAIAESYEQLVERIEREGRNPRRR